MSETQPNHEFDDFVFIILAYNATLDWPERESLLVHYSVNYLLNHGIPGTRITVLANDLSVCSWANQQGLKFIQLKATDKETVMEAISSTMQENPGKNVACLNTVFPPKNIYPVLHTAECGNYKVSFRYEYMKEPLEAAVAVGYKMSAWSAPCPSEYPRRVEIKLDNGMDAR